MTSPTSIAFGESLIDEYPDRRVVAGAPLHVAIHLACAGWRSLLWSRVGTDQDGEEIRSTVLDYGVDATLLQTDGEAATGTVGIEMPERGEHSFTIRAPSAWDHIEPTESLPVHDVFYYGTLAARHPMSASTLWHGLEVSQARFRIFDVNLRPPHDDMSTVERGLRHATLVKMNSDEFEQIRLALGSPRTQSPCSVGTAGSTRFASLEGVTEPSFIPATVGSRVSSPPLSIRSIA